MTSMLNLGNVLELVIDGLNNGAFAQQELVVQADEHIPHIFAQPSNQLQASGVEKLLKERLRNVALVAEEFAEQMRSELGNGLGVMHIGCAQTAGEQLPTIIDNHMQLEAVEPTH